MQTHLRVDVFQGSHLEMRPTHPDLNSSKGVFYSLSA